MATEQMKASYIDEDGMFCLNPCSNAANDDWIRAGRLKEQANKGDKKAAAKLAKLEATPMLREVEDGA